MTVLNSYQTKDVYLLRQIGKLSQSQIQMQTQKAVVRHMYGILSVMVR